jgi:hypothetical protein
MAADDGAGADTTRGLRAANLAIADVRDELHHLAAQVVALVDVVGARLGAPIAAEVEAAAAGVLAQLELSIEGHGGAHRLQLGTDGDKYAATAASPPCAELFPICGARCCGLRFPLTSQDLDEGVIRWDHAQPYLIRHADGACVHQDRATGACGEYARRPAICRTYDCRDDPRIWLDFAARIPAPLAALAVDDRPITRDTLVERVRARRLALAGEAQALRVAGDGVRDPDDA